MNPSKPKPDFSRITFAIVNSIVDSLGEPDFDLDEGTIRFIDRDEKCVWLGLYETDDTGDGIAESVVATWTIEVSLETKGAE
jgi:hypothetical protein